MCYNMITIWNNLQIYSSIYVDKNNLEGGNSCEKNDSIVYIVDIRVGIGWMQ